MADKTFTGTGNWTTAARWSGSSLPTNGQSVEIGAGAICTLDDDLITDGVTLTGLQVTGTLNCSTSTGTYSISCTGNINGAGTINATTEFEEAPQRCISWKSEDLKT